MPGRMSEIEVPDEDLPLLAADRRAHPVAGDVQTRQRPDLPVVGGVLAPGVGFVELHRAVAPSCREEASVGREGNCGEMTAVHFQTAYLFDCRHLQNAQ